MEDSGAFAGCVIDPVPRSGRRARSASPPNQQITLTAGVETVWHLVAAQEIKVRLSE
jgi:hypothetical protein